MIEQDAFKRPNLDYVVTKIPRWPFDKFPTANRLLGTQMKATGEVMAIGRTFTESLQKAIRSLELDNISLLHPEARFLSEEELIKRLIRPDDMRIHLLAEFLRRGGSVEELVNLTNIHPFFLHEIDRLVKFFLELCSQEELNRDLLREAKRLGFSDEIIGEAVGLEVKTIRDFRVKWGIRPSFCKVDAGILPYYYSTYNKENEVVLDRSKQTVIVLGSGPIRIGQGIEFDFSTVHAAWTIRDKGYAAVIINNNPETVSTDYFTSDRLYFEPLVEEDVWEVIQFENPEGVLVQFGGQTAINLVRFLENEQIAIRTTAENTFGMEDRNVLIKRWKRLKFRPAGYTADTIDEAFKIAEKINYPVVVRPSFVLGGRGMEVVGNQASLREYLTGLRITQEAPLLIDSYIAGLEVELDAISDGEDVFIPGVMEHLERAGVHSGDSIAVFPSQNLSADTLALIADYTKRIANYFQVKGFLNIQFVIANNTVYVLEVNPRSSRTIPFLSKVTGISLAELATRVVLGEKLSELGYVGLRQFTDEIISVKVPVFSFAKLLDTEINLGPEMKSTGEVMGRAKNLAQALYKGFIAAKVPVNYHGKALVTVADKDKAEIVELARALDRQGFDIYATEGTCKTLQAAGITCKQVVKLQEGQLS